MLLRFILGLVGLFSVGAQTTCCDPSKTACTAGVPLCSDMMMPQVTIPPSPSVQPTYFPLPPIEVTSSTMSPSMTFGICNLPAVDIAFVNTDLNVRYVMNRVLSCCMKIPITNIPIIYIQTTRPASPVTLLNAANWTNAVTPRLSSACNLAYISPSASASRTPLISTYAQMLTTSKPTPSTSPSTTLRVILSESSTMTPKIQPSESSTITPKIVEKPSESSTMTPKIVERPSESSTMTPKIRPSESSTMTPKIQPSESSTMTPKIVERPSESSTMTPKIQPSESSTMTPKIVERPSESSTMTLRVQEPTPAPADVIMPPERPSESPTMTPRIQEKPSESSTMTPRVIERPSESSTMTPKTIFVERPSWSNTPTSSVEESAHADVIEHESESVTPRYIERPSQSNTITPKIREPSPDVFIQPVEDSRVSPIAEQILEQPTKSPSSTKSQKIVPSLSSTLSSTLSSAPSRMPYRYPSMSVSKTVSPTKTVKYVRPSSSALPSRLPVPTKYVILSPIPVTRRPTPTSIRTQKPAVINSQLTINNGNVTYLSQPQTLQYIQASLACAAGVPLESIRILNITQRANGTQSVVLYDKGVPGLSSGGSAVCYRPKTTPTAKAGRRLQVVDESAVTVDYVIVDPPIEILEPVAFIEAVTRDEGLTQIMLESGSTGMDAIVPQEIVDYAAVAAVVEPPVQVVENKTPMYIGLALGLGGLCGLIAGVAVVLHARRKRAAKPLTRHVEIVELNPTVRVIGAGSERQIFVPGQVRV